MMSKAVRILFSFLIFLSVTVQVKAQDLLISGGNTVSTIICANGFVYTWGAGVTSPTKVNFPTNDPYFTSLNSGITVKAVDAGSGAHFIAVDCKGGAWSWGNNGTVGITGTGQTGASVATPARVLRGEAPASANANLAPYLVNVKYVSGGNDNSYVILEDGRALAWGRNDKGQLGNGTLVNSPTPVFIRTPNGQPLQNVIQVEAGDETGYALTADGTVYSWGAGTGQFGGTGMLGRNAAGTANSGTETANDTYARPVLKKDGTPLTNIVSISAADVMCLALDASGYVWAWGNDGWGSMTGQGTTVGDHSDPRQVVAGEWGTTAGAGLGETYLKAKAISGGQGYGMAVTIDGKPVAWGNNGACGAAGAGGSLGDGTVTTRPAPVFIRRNATTVDNNVVSISDGDTWGFYTNAKNEIYTWGNNAVGQLGLGNTTCQSYAVQFTLPPCTWPAPKPVANLAPRDFSVCSAKWLPAGTLLNSGFVVASTLQPDYKITWSKDGVVQQTGTGALNTYTAKATGVWKVKVEYVGADAPCDAYLPAEDEITITEYPQDFTVPTGLTFCGNTLNPYVSSGNGLYTWYAAATGGNPLDTTYRTGKASILKSALTPSGNTYTVYVEEKGFVSGNSGAATPAGCTYEDMDDPSKSNTMIRIYDEKVTIDTITVYHKGEYLGSTKTYNWQVCVYGTKLVNGKAIADRTNIVGCGPVKALPSHDNQNGYVALKIPVNVTLDGAASGVDYWIGFSDANPGKRATYFKCNPAYPVEDDIPGGEYLNMVGADKYANPNNTAEWGEISNIKFTTGQRFCTRVPVVLTQSCPCTPPTTVKITTPTTATTTICQGSNLTITATVDVTGLSPLNGAYYYTWYKGTTAITTPSTTAALSYTITGATLTDGGVYKLRVEDGNNGNSSCYKEASVTVVVNAKIIPGAIAAHQTICSGTIPAALTSTTAASGGDGSTYSYAWQSSTDGISYANNTPAATAPTYAPGALTATTWYKRQVTSGVCPAVTTDSVKITVTPALTAGVIGSDQTICYNTIPAQFTFTTAPTGGSGTFTYQWQESTNGTTFTNITNATTNTYTAPAALTADKWYRVTVASSPCAPLNTAAVKVTVRPKLTAGAITATGTTICYNTAAPTITQATAAAGGSGTYTYTWVQSANNSAPWAVVAGQAGTTLSPGNLTATTYYRRIATDAVSACGNDTTASVKITVYPNLTAGSVGADQTICYNSVPAAFTELTAATGGTGSYTYQWQSSTNGTTYANVASGGTGATYTSPALTATTYFRRNVTSGTCGTLSTASVKVTVNPQLTSGTIGSDQSICANTAPATITELTPATGGDGVYSYLWESSTDGGANWILEFGAGNVSFSPGNLTETTQYRRTAVSQGCTPAVSNVVTITVLPGLDPGTIAADQTICYNATAAALTSGSPASGGAGAGTYVYSWEKSENNSPWTVIPGEATTTLTPGQLTATTQFRRVVISGTGTCNRANTTPVTITVNPDLTAGAIGGTETICEGKTPTGLTNVSLPTGGTGTYVYSWESSVNGGPWSAITNSNSSAYTPGPLTTSTSFRRKVTSGTCGSLYTSQIDITVTPNVTPAVSITPAGTVSICAGEPVNFVASPVNEGTSASYQWYVGTTPVGTNSPTFSSTTLANGDQVKVVLTSSITCVTAQTATSNIATMNVTGAVTPAVTVTGNNTICDGTSVTFTASAVNGGTTPSYQWYLGTTPVGTNQNTYTSSTLANGDQVSVVMTSSSSCATVPTATSNKITMTVNPNLPVSVTVTPDPVVVCKGAAVNLTANPVNGGTSPAYKWMIDGVQAPNYTTAAYSSTTLAEGSHTITVELTSSETCKTNSPATGTASVTVNPNLPVSVSINDPGQLCQGTAANFTATPTNGGTTPSYQWYVGGALVAGETNATFASSSLTNGQVVTVVLTSSETCKANSPATSNSISMNVVSSITPAVSINDPGAICQGANASFTAVPTNGGSAPTYQWYVDNTPVATGSTFSTTTLNNGSVVKVEMTSNAQCVINNPATSNAVTMTVNANAPVSVNITPTPVTVCQGQQVSLTANPVNGGNSPTYKWFVDGIAVPVTTPTFTTNALPAGTRSITVQLTSSLTCKSGSPATSQAAIVNVNQSLPVSVSITTPGQLCEGYPATFTANPSNGGTSPTYTWYVKGVQQATTAATFTSSTLNNGDEVKVVLTSSETCKVDDPAEAKVNAQIFHIPAISAVPVGQTTVCTGGSVIINSSVEGGTASVTSYEWIMNQTTSTNVTTDYFAAYASGKYSVVVTFTGGCVDTSDAVDITVVPYPSPVITGNDTTVCQGTVVALTAVPSQAGALQWYKNGTPIPAPQGTGLSYNVNETGIYTVGEYNGACSKTAAPVTVTVVPKPVAYAGEDQYVLEGTTVGLHASGGIPTATYSWTPSARLINPNTQDPAYVATDQTTLTVTVSNITGCESSDDVTIYVERPVVVVNSFTPNGDGNNDTWEIKNIQNYPNCEVLIYNRWGNLVWKSNGYLHEWPGTDYRNDELLPVATYYYIIYLNGKVINTPLKGDVTIVR